MLSPHYVISSTVNALGYSLGKLYVRFNSGVTYSYDEVPYSIYDALKKAESCGQSLHRLVKKAHFHYQKLDSDPFTS